MVDKEVVSVVEDVDFKAGSIQDEATIINSIKPIKTGTSSKINTTSARAMAVHHCSKMEVSLTESAVNTRRKALIMASFSNHSINITLMPWDQLRSMRLVGDYLRVKTAITTSASHPLQPTQHFNRFYFSSNNIRHHLFLSLLFFNHFSSSGSRNQLTICGASRQMTNAT